MMCLCIVVYMHIVFLKCPLYVSTCTRSLCQWCCLNFFHWGERAIAEPGALCKFSLYSTMFSHWILIEFKCILMSDCCLRQDKGDVGGILSPRIKPKWPQGVTLAQSTGLDQSKWLSWTRIHWSSDACNVIFLLYSSMDFLLNTYNYFTLILFWSKIAKTIVDSWQSRFKGGSKSCKHDKTQKLQYGI